MPETPEQLYARVAGSLRMPPVEEWETFPFDGEMRPRVLRPPEEGGRPPPPLGLPPAACPAPAADRQLRRDLERPPPAGPGGDLARGSRGPRRRARLRRVNVKGTSGSGKSTFAAELARRLDVPYVELDALHHGPNWSEPTDEEFQERVREAMAGAPDGWVIDGNYE